MQYGIGIIEAWTFDFLILIKDLLATNILTCLAGGHKFTTPVRFQPHSRRPAAK